VDTSKSVRPAPVDDVLFAGWWLPWSAVDPYGDELVGWVRCNRGEEGVLSPNPPFGVALAGRSGRRNAEVFFSIIDRKVLTLNDFDDLGEVIDRLAKFEDRYNKTAKPFKWKFTTTDLADFLTRLDQHQPAEPRAA
jgi:hypothetical protein